MAIKVSLLKRVWRTFTWAPVVERIQLGGAHIEAHVGDDDGGLMQCSLALANFCFREVIVEGIHLNHIAIGNGSLSDFNPHMESARVRIPRRSIGDIQFSHRLTAADIRGLQRWVTKTYGGLSSPSARTDIVGTLDVKHWRGRQQVAFHVTGIIPFLSLHNPSSLTGGA